MRPAEDNDGFERAAEGLDGEGKHDHAWIILGFTIEELSEEVKPMERSVGDNIQGGARTLDGMLIVKATKSWKDSTLSRIVELLQELHNSGHKLARRG
ncbi:hypothetical protein Droror1_Dr00019851 [Drosera rotundifolia]